MSAGRVARAAPDAGGLASIELTYDVATGCPSRGEFLELVRARHPSDHGGTADSRRRVAVVVRTDERGYTGRITSQEGERAQLVRDVSAGSCREVADALAFIAAVAADPSAGAAPEPVPPPEDQPPRFSAGQDESRGRQSPPGDES